MSRRLPSGDRTLTILDDVSLRIDPGGTVAIVGPSGSGKSTLLALLAGLDRPSDGSVHMLGQRLDTMGEDALALFRRRHVGFVFQSFHLLGHLTAQENVSLPLELLGDREAPARAAELLDRVGLADRGHHRPVQLSGGEQQRVALARAFAARPDVLLADEPTGNLDAATGQRILKILDELRAASGTTMILVTHDQQLADRCDRVIALEAGRVVSDRVAVASASTAAADSGR
ncbi:MAG: ABC transporter ATP-binding protein [Phycisphaerales bacterium]